MLKRAIEDKVLSLMGRNKVILILGSRRVGKTVLINRVKEKYRGKNLLLNGEDFEVHALLRNRSAANYKRIINNTPLLIIDEAQAIPEIGQVLKLMIDSMPDLTILATGSSCFDLLNKSGEPLTGRQYRKYLFPLAQLEIQQTETALETKQHLEERLIFGSYPELFQLSTVADKIEYLQELANSYLLKDILAFEGIRHSDKLGRLLRLIAHQVGQEVSFAELGSQLGLSKNTVENYLDLLSKVFILYRLGSYSSNPRKEISKGSKWYFYDNGVRNAIINDFRLLPLRADIGALWENYLISERIKRNEYAGKKVEYYFWRTYSQQEVDLIELEGGNMAAYEFKWSSGKKIKAPVAFANLYPDAQFKRISTDNYLDWIL